MGLAENLFISAWNRFATKPAALRQGLRAGQIVVDGRVTDRWLTIPWATLVMHIWLLGVTGAGKTRFIQSLLKAAIHNDIAFIVNSVHGDLPPYVMSAMAEWEARTGKDLGGTIVPLNMADGAYSAAFNLLEVDDLALRFTLVAEMCEILRVRWNLDNLGARTTELLRNSIYVLSQAGLTLLELFPFLTDVAFRLTRVHACDNPAVRAYFRDHFDRLSEAQQLVYVAPVTNKLSEMTSDPAIAELIGQTTSSITLRQALDDGTTVLLMTDKARFGEQALTLASLFAIKEKNAVFARQKRHLALLVFDELQNFLRQHGGVIETLLTEGRKQGAAVIAAHQSLEQVPSDVRAALLGSGTQVFFRLAASDAEKVASYLDGGRHLAQRLRNLPLRHAIVKTATAPITEIVVPDVPDPDRGLAADLYRRCRARWMRPRADIAADIEQRQQELHKGEEEGLHGWD